MTGQELFDLIQGHADRGGEHYAPCFRDCLGDNEKWVVPLLEQALTAAHMFGRAEVRREVWKSHGDGQ